jgi:hypothetical protein
VNKTSTDFYKLKAIQLHNEVDKFLKITPFGSQVEDEQKQTLESRIMRSSTSSYGEMLKLSLAPSPSMRQFGSMK